MYWNVLIVFGSRGLSVPEGVIAVVILDEEVTVVEVEVEERTLEELLDEERTGVMVEVETELDEVDELIGLVVDKEDEDDDDAVP